MKIILIIWVYIWLKFMKDNPNNPDSPDNSLFNPIIQITLVYFIDG